MTRLPVLRPKDAVKALERAGFDLARVRGSHYQLVDRRTGRRVTVPMHNRDLSRATLGSIIHQAGLTIDAFVALL